MEVVIVAVLFIGFLVWLIKSSSNPHDRPQGRSEPVSHRRQPIVSKRTRPSSPQIRSVAPIPQNQILTGPAYVTDGDGLRIQKTEVRLFGIDAPEFAHPHGKKAKWALFGLCKGQTVRAEVTGQDDHGRTVAKCFLPDGRDLSAEMVKLGLALDWAKFSGGIYRGFETPDARKKMWLADARQKGRIHVWEKFEAQQIARKSASKPG